MNIYGDLYKSYGSTASCLSTFSSPPPSVMDQERCGYLEVYSTLAYSGGNSNRDSFCSSDDDYTEPLVGATHRLSAAEQIAIIAKRARAERDCGRCASVRVNVRDVSPVPLDAINRTMQLPKSRGGTISVLIAPTHDRIRSYSRAVLAPHELQRVNLDALPTVTGALC